MADDDDDSRVVVIGVVALQGAFREHVQHIERLNNSRSSTSMSTGIGALPRLQATLVRTPRELERCAALILPGGESTAIALGAQRAGLLEPLRDWVRDGRPVWGTCAGMILLSREASGIKKGGQELLGGIDIRVGRNGFGSQVDSFEHQLHISALAKATGNASPFPGVFIRAPVVESLLLPEDLAAVPSSEATIVGRGRGEAHEGFVVQQQDRLSDENTANATNAASLRRPSAAGRAVTDVAASSLQQTISVAPPLERQSETRRPHPSIEILATLPRLPRGAPPSAGGSASSSGYQRSPAESGLIGARPEHDSMIVALKQGNLMCTSFHPELTTDARLHEFFVRRCVLQQQHS